MGGAWTLEAGRGLVISSVSASRTEARFTSERERADAPLFRKAEIQVLAEYGITDRFTLRGKGSVEQWRQDGAEPPDHRGFGVQEIGGRFRLIERGGFVASTEASLRSTREDGERGLEGEARLLGGYGFEIAGRASFVDAQLGYRLRPEAGDEIVVDLTFGIRPFDRTLLLFQSFSTVAAGLGETGRPLHDRHEVEASVVFDLSETMSLQAGLGRTLIGSDASVEESVFGALWLRF